MSGIKGIENDLQTIAVDGPSTPFGVVRKAGTMVYDETNKKMYFLTAQAGAGDSLTSATKTEV